MIKQRITFYFDNGSDISTISDDINLEMMGFNGDQVITDSETGKQIAINMKKVFLVRKEAAE